MASGDRSWGHRAIWRWVGAGLLALLIGYIGWTFFHQASDMGDWCEHNNDCRSSMCLKEQGRHIQYCTVRCTQDAECPTDWKCLDSPDLANRRVCIQP